MSKQSSKATPKSASLHRGPGFRIREFIDRPEQNLIDGFAEFPTPDVSDILNRLYAMNPALKRFTGSGLLVGSACTVKVYPGDNLMVHKSLDIAKPGDVVVIDAGGSKMNGLVGDLICTKAKHRGIRGFVIDGLFRDIEEVAAIGMPVFARGVTPIGPLHRGPGEINFPVSCGGIVVNPGDLICADDNGIVVVRQDFAADTLERLRKQASASMGYEANVRRGIFDNSWADRLLEDAGCVYVK